MKKKIVALLMAGTMAMTLPISTNVTAANTTDTAINFDVNALNFNKTTGKREKQNTTPIYIHVTSLEDRSSVRVRALGVAGANSENLTNNGTSLKRVSYVTCKLKTKYSIHNDIKEKGYGYAKLGFQSLNTINSERVKGVWSPDSTKTYTHAWQ